MVFFNLCERIIRQHKVNTSPKELPWSLAAIRGFAQRVYTLLVVVIGWVFFRVPGLKNGVKYVLSMFGLLDCPTAGFLSPSFYLDKWTTSALVLAVLLSTPLPNKLVCFVGEKLPESAASILRDLALLAALILCILQIASNTYSAFIYFQF